MRGRRISRPLLWALALLAVFAVVVDGMVMVAASYLSPLLETCAVFAETTGERLSMTFALLVVLWMLSESDAPLDRHA